MGSKVVTFKMNHTKFKGQFDLEGQCHQFSNPSWIFGCLIKQFKLEGKIPKWFNF